MGLVETVEIATHLLAVGLKAPQGMLDAIMDVVTLDLVKVEVVDPELVEEVVVDTLEVAVEII